MTDLSIPPMKRCSKCKAEKPATKEYFHKRGDRDAWTSHCIECHREAGRLRKRRFKLEHPEKALEIGRKDAKKFREKNPDKVHNTDNERRRKRFLEDPEKERARDRARNKKWRERNPLKHRARVSRNRVKRKGHIANTIEGHYTDEDVKLQLKSQKDKCWWCGKKLAKKYHADHRIPLAKGGSNSANNICITCPDCNWQKNAKFSWEWNGRLL